MCGIAGYIRTTDNTKYLPTQPTFNALRDINYMNRVRGIDALGIARVGYSGNWETYKQVGDPKTLWEKDKGIIDITKYAGDPRFFMMHNRHATKGSKTQHCAHPYVIPKKSGGDNVIIGVHNGTLHHIVDEYKYPGVTDSQSLFKMIAAGMSLSDVDVNIWGAYALVWYDSEDHTLNFFRNEERPLGFAICDNSIWFGSECYMIGAGVDRHGFKLEKFEKLPIHEHWKYHADSRQWEKKKVEIQQNPIDSRVNAVLSQLGHGMEGDPSVEQGCDYSDIFKDEPKLPPDFFKDDDDASITKPPVQTNVRPFPNYSPKFQRNKVKAKEKWEEIEEHSGYKKGDSVIFSLLDVKRPHMDRCQLQIVGTLLNWNGSLHNYTLVTTTEVVGMIGGDDATALLKIEDTFEAIITSISSCSLGAGTTKYRFRVRDIKRNTDDKDMFFGMQRQWKLPKSVQSLLKETPQNPLEPKSQTTPLVITTPTTDGDNSKLSEDFFQCADCQTWFRGADKKKFKRIFDTPKLVVNLNFCPGCMEAVVCDDSRLQRLLDEAVSKNKATFEHPSSHVHQPSHTLQ